MYHSTDNGTNENVYVAADKITLIKSVGNKINLYA